MKLRNAPDALRCEVMSRPLFFPLTLSRAAIPRSG